MTTNTPFILFITGVSASGKTTLYESLQDDQALAEIRFHDIDENGVPPVGRGPWRKYRVEQLLYDAVTRMNEQNLSTIVCGISFPHEVIESQYYDLTCNIHFLLIETSMELFEKRIAARRDAIAKEGAFDESLDAHHHSELVRVTTKNLKTLNNTIANQKNGHRIDATNLTKQQMHDRAVEVISSIARST